MKRCLPLLLILPLLLTGCTAAAPLPGPDTAQLVGVAFDRGHGSMWGYQFYMHLTPEEIASVYFFPADISGSDPVECSHVPLTAEQWAQAEAAVLALHPYLEPVKEPTFWDKLSARFRKVQMLDGGSSRTLSLTWRLNGEDVTVGYRWSSCDEASALETLLETIANHIDIEMYKEEM